MKKFKDLEACISVLEEIHRRNDIDPEQKQAVDEAIGEVKRIRRKNQIRRQDVHQSVRRITEKLVRAFVKIS